MVTGFIIFCALIAIACNIIARTRSTQTSGAVHEKLERAASLEPTTPMTEEMWDESGIHFPIAPEIRACGLFIGEDEV